VVEDEVNRDSTTGLYAAARQVYEDDRDEVRAEVRPFNFVPTRGHQPQRLEQQPPAPPHNQANTSGSSKRAAPTDSSRGSATKQRRLDYEDEDEDDEVVCLS
jgi:hypothetical protein